MNRLLRPHIILNTLILLASFGCSSPTRFVDNKKNEDLLRQKRIQRNIASTAHEQKGCFTLMSEIFYLKEQRDHKEKDKKKIRNSFQSQP